MTDDSDDDQEPTDSEEFIEILTDRFSCGIEYFHLAVFRSSYGRLTRTFTHADPTGENTHLPTFSSHR